MKKETGIKQKNRTRSRGNREGFVPVELICVLGIIMVLILVSIPLIRNLREESRRNLDANNARSIYRTLETKMEEGDLDLTRDTANGSLYVLVQSSDPKRRLKYNSSDELNLYLDSDQNVIVHGFTGSISGNWLSSDKQSKDITLQDELRYCFGKGGMVLHCKHPDQKLKKTAVWDWYMIRFTIDENGMVNGRIYSGSHSDPSTALKYYKDETNIEKYMKRQKSGTEIKETFWQVRRRTLT